MQNEAVGAGRARLDSARRGRTGRALAALSAAVALAVSAAACGEAGGGGAASSSSGSGSIKVGIALPLTGNAAAPGADERAGWDLAIAEAGGAVNGRKIETLYADDAGDPNLGLTVTRNLIEQRQVDAYVMPIFANVSLAVRKYVGARGVPAIAAVSACWAETEGFTSAKNIVNAGATCDASMLPLGRYVAEELGYKKVTTIGMDYAFGWEQIGGFKSQFEAAGGTVEKELWAPITTPDWAPYLSQIPKDTDAVIALMAGAQGPRFLKTYREFGLKESIPLIGGGTMTDFLDNMPPADAEGVVTALHYADGLETPENQAFVEAFRKKTSRTPSYEAEGGYAAGKLLIAALQKVKGNVEDREKFIAALKETPVTAPRGPLKIDADTLAPTQNQYIRRVETVDGKLTNKVVKTYTNVPPWGEMDKAQWEKRFFDNSRKRP
jgi:branched-chain amino acid transport system substrate-binding protein